MSKKGTCGRINLIGLTFSFAFGFIHNEFIMSQNMIYLVLMFVFSGVFSESIRKFSRQVRRKRRRAT